MDKRPERTHPVALDGQRNAHHEGRALPQGAPGMNEPAVLLHDLARARRERFNAYRRMN